MPRSRHALSGRVGARPVVRTDGTRRLPSDHRPESLRTARRGMHRRTGVERHVGRPLGSAHTPERRCGLSRGCDRHLVLAPAPARPNGLGPCGPGRPLRGPTGGTPWFHGIADHNTGTCAAGAPPGLRASSTPSSRHGLPQSASGTWRRPLGAGARRPGADPRRSCCEAGAGARQSDGGGTRPGGTPGLAAPRARPRALCALGSPRRGSPWDRAATRQRAALA